MNEVSIDRLMNGLQLEARFDRLARGVLARIRTQLGVPETTDDPAVEHEFAVARKRLARFQDEYVACTRRVADRCFSVPQLVVPALAEGERLVDWVRAAETFFCECAKEHEALANKMIATVLYQECPE